MKLSSSTVLSAAFTLLGAVAARPGLAQQGTIQPGDERVEGWVDLNPRLTLQQGNGVRLSESAILHAGVGVEGGYDSNVFYSEDATEIDSPLLRVLPYLSLTNQGRPGGGRGSVTYNLSTSLEYREYLSDQPEVRDQRAFNPSIGAGLGFGSGQTFSLTLSDTFVRLQDAPWEPSSSHVTRDHNFASLQLSAAPQGGRIRGIFRYTNELDYYEEELYEYATNMTHRLLLEGNWRWLPKTALYLQFQSAIIDYLKPDSGGQPRSNSYPLTVLTGVRGLITEKVAADLGVGYTTSFYSIGPDPTGSANVAINASISYRPTPFTNLGLGYVHGFQNSPVIGNFYELDGANLSIRQLIASRVVVGLVGRYEYRRYEGVRLQNAEIDRNDHFARAGANLDYHVQPWLFFGAAYQFSYNDSDITREMGGVSYNKHMVFGRVGITY